MFFSRLFHLLGSAALAVFLALPAQTEPLAKIEPLNKVDEQLRPDALISGNWLVGVHTTAQRTQNAPRLYSYVPSGWNGHIVCVRVTDEEGRYTALYEYEMPGNWVGGLAEFNYPTAYVDHVKTIDATNSGVALHKGDCAKLSDIFVPVHWNALEDPIGPAPGQLELVLNVNAGRADSVFGVATFENASGVEPIDMTCAPTQKRGVGFNYTCSLAVPGDREAILSIEIKRLRFGREAPPRKAKIALFPLLAQ